MRILHVNKYLYRRGGAESYMLDLADLQRDAGHEVELWGMAHPDNGLGLALRDTFAPFVELDPAPAGLRGISAAGRMVWSLASARGMSRAVEAFRPDVVHLHNIYHQLSPSILRPIAAAGVPSVMTLHDYKLACPSYQMLDHGELCDRCVGNSTWHAAAQRCKGDSLTASAMLSVESAVHRRTDAYGSIAFFLCPSRFLQRVMTQQGIATSRLTVLPNFADHAAARQRTGPGNGFAFAGRLSPEKGVDVLVHAAASMTTDAPVLIAGDGPERSRLERLAAEVAPQRVRFLGRLTRAEVSELITGSRATLVPSRWHENQPMAILESFAARVPVIATSLGGMPELVENGKQGLVVPPNDPGALAGAMDTLAADPDLAERLGAAARARVVTNHDARTHLDLVSQAYERASGTLA